MAALVVATRSVLSVHNEIAGKPICRCRTLERKSISYSAMNVCRGVRVQGFYEMSEPLGLSKNGADFPARKNNRPVPLTDAKATADIKKGNRIVEKIEDIQCRPKTDGSK